jgi:hypothetical protein
MDDANFWRKGVAPLTIYAKKHNIVGNMLKANKTNHHVWRLAKETWRATDWN